MRSGSFSRAGIDSECDISIDFERFGSIRHGSCISWLANANMDGSKTFTDAKAWAANLDVSGVTGWRLPDADPACGKNFNCTNSEMGHLFYTELGVEEDKGITTSTNTQALSLFSNVAENLYWTGTSVAGTGWFFGTNTGLQSFSDTSPSFLAWAVHDGNVGASNAVPEPGTIALMGLGLVGLFGFARRQKQL